MSINETVDEEFTRIRDIVSQMNPSDALKWLFDLENHLYLLQGQKAIAYGNGIHTKHKHINYHKFFTDNISAGENVLDIGSSSGELTSDIAKKALPGEVVGIEIDPEKVAHTEKTYNLTNLKFITGDATEISLERNFDVITLSNVLEHIEDRVKFLQKIVLNYSPKKVIIRVPMFTRDWRVPLKRELGVDYRLDNTHFIEYTEEEFLTEMESAQLGVVKLKIIWGEIWAVLSIK